VDDRAHCNGGREQDRERRPTSKGKSARAPQTPTVSLAPGRTTFPRGLRLSALLLVSVVISVRPFFAGTPDDFILTVLLGSLLALAFGLTLVSRWPEKALPVLWTPLHGPLLLFALATLWGLRLGTWQPEAVLRGLDYLSLLLLALLLAELSVELEERRLLLLPLLGSLFVMVLYGYYQYFWEFDRMLAEMAAKPIQVQQELGISQESWPDFVSRVEGREIFSTFLMSNSLGGYLVLLLPVLAGYLCDRLRTGRRGPWRVVELSLLAIMVAAGGAALLLSRVKGAWLALGGASVLGALLLLAWRRLRRLWPALVLGVCLAAGLFFWWLWRTDVTRRVLVNDSLGARLGFWHGALQVIGKHPLGVGIDRFQPYYLQDKLPSAHEVDLPHCVWLEVLVELGPLGLLALIWFAASGLGLALEEATRPRQRDGPPSAGPPDQAPGSFPYLFLMTTGLLAFGLVGWLSDAWAGPLTLALGGAWLVTACLLARSTPDSSVCEAGRGLRVGLVFGLLAFLLHASIDIDFYAPAIPTTAVALLVVVGWRPPENVRTVSLSRRRAMALGLLAILATVGYARGVARPLLEIQGEKEVAKHDAQEGRGAAARRRLEEVLERTPDDVQATIELAGVASGQASSPEGTEADFRRAEELWRRLTALRPESFQGYYQLGELYQAWREKAAGPGGRQLTGAASDREAGAQELLRRAEAAYQDALIRYPTWPLLRVKLAGVYHTLGDDAGAVVQYREALRLSPLLTQTIRRLTPEQVAEVESRLAELGRKDEGKTPR